MRTHQIIVFAVATVGVALLCARRKRVAAGLKEYFNAETSPVNLAVFRIAVFGALASLLPRFDAGWFASLPPDLRVAPKGWGPVFWLVPFDPTFARVCQGVCLLACVATACGVWTRQAACLALVTGLYVCGLTQFFGKLNHFHHLFWFAALLAASPCGDALSFGGRNQPRPGPSRAYALPLRLAWVMIGVLYFFPGFWKLWISGPEWAGGENLRFLMHEIWYYDHDFRPFVRADRDTVLLALAGIGTIAFEMGFIFLIFSNRTRWIAVASGVLFHIGTDLFLHIKFYELLVCYVAFLDLDKHASGPACVRDTRPITAVAAVLLFCNVACGALGVDSWPFAVYPTFAHPGSPQRTFLEVRFLDEDGSELDYDAEPVLSKLTHSRYARLLVRISETKEPRLCRALITLLLKETPGLERARRVRLYSVVVRTDPDHLDGNPVRREQILELDLTPGP